MTNRSKAPSIKVVDTIELHQPTLHHLKNGIPVYEINLGSQQVIKLELVFKAGRWYEKDKLIAKTTSQLLKAGSIKHNAEQMADFFEYYGAKLDIYDGFNHVTVQLYCLSKHLGALLPVLRELLSIPAFPEKELQKYIKRNQQKLKVQLKKNDVVAYRIFTEKLFGENHPYGYNSTKESYAQITIPKIKAHFEAHYTAENCMIIIAGKTSPEIIELLHQHWDDFPSKPAQEEPVWELPEIKTGYTINQPISEDSSQVSIRIGRRTFDREHPDNDAFYMMNMVLGGYFGSRLMQNLRERNGYTYGVYSSMETLRYSGYWYISSDVGKDVKDAALSEIYHEITRLQNKPISAKELEMVRNYTLGMQLTALDGVFNVSGVISSLVTVGLDEQNFYQFVERVKNITAKEIQAMAQKYLNREDLIEVVV